MKRAVVNATCVQERYQSNKASVRDSRPEWAPGLSEIKKKTNSHSLIWPLLRLPLSPLRARRAAANVY
jgi:hypothetical protein